jgi:hypothetical protein
MGRTWTGSARSSRTPLIERAGPARVEANRVSCEHHVGAGDGGRLLQAGQLDGVLRREGNRADLLHLLDMLGGLHHLLEGPISTYGVIVIRWAIDRK